jgi:glutamyl-tRNA reductase
LTHRFVEEVISIAEASLGGLRGRSALLIGPEELRQPYSVLLQQAGMKYIYQEDTHGSEPAIIPHVQLLMNLPVSSTSSHPIPQLTASAIAQGCIGRRAPLLIFDLAESTSVEELAGLLPAVCLYTPDDLHKILQKDQVHIEMVQ